MKEYILCDSIYIMQKSVVEKKKKTEHWLLCAGGRVGNNWKGHEGNFWGEDYIVSLHRSLISTGEGICQTLLQAHQEEKPIGK